MSEDEGEGSVLELEVMRLTVMVNSLVQVVRELRDNHARQNVRIAALSHREPLVDQAAEDP